MSKVIAGTVFVLLGGATAAGGVLLSRNSGKNATEFTYDHELPTEKLNEKIHEEGCVTQMFGAQTQFETTPSIAQNSDWGITTPDNFFPAGKDTKGCLVVNWDKKTRSSDNKWSGTIRFLWAVKGETKGFVVFLVGTGQKSATENENKISWQGGGYLMELQNDSKTWKPTKKSPSQTSASMSKTETDSAKFPQPGQALTTSDTSSKISDFWGWITGAGDLANLEGEASLTDAANSSLRAYWDWNGQRKDNPEENKKMSDWTKCFDTWWNVVFGSSQPKVKDVADKQEGTWTNKYYKKLPETEKAST